MEFDGSCWQALARLKPDWAHGDVTDIRYLEGGYANRNFALNYCGVGYVIRVVGDLPPALAVDRSRERAVLEIAHALSPPLEAFVLPHGHMLTRRVRGPLLMEAETTLGDRGAYLAYLHASLARGDAGGVPAPRYDLAGIVTRYFETASRGGFTPHHRALAWLERIGDWRGDAVFCHNDLNPWNIVAAGGSPRAWVTLDWELAGFNNPLFDVLGLCCGLGLAREAESEVVRSYCDLTGRTRPDHDELELARGAFMLREYGWALCQESLGNRRREVVAQRRWSLDALTE